MVAIYLVVVCALYRVPGVRLDRKQEDRFTPAYRRPVFYNEDWHRRSTVVDKHHPAVVQSNTAGQNNHGFADRDFYHRNEVHDPGVGFCVGRDVCRQQVNSE